MKTTLKISLLLNAVLIGSGLYFYAGQRKISAPSVPPVKSENAAPAAAVSAPTTQGFPHGVAHAEVPFRWEQLVAPDYHVYVKNLRAVGCPEDSVRAIVSEDVHAAYDVQIKALEKKLSDLGTNSWSSQAANLAAEQALKEEMAELPDREFAEIADLLGLKVASSTAAVVSASVSADGDEDESQEAKPELTAMVLQEIDQDALGLDDDQMAAISNLRQSFLDKVGADTNQDPNDPAYLARWQKEKPTADSMLRFMMGGNAYAKFLIAQNQAAQSQ